MRWITSITLNNYRAFKGPYPSIVIPEDCHLLIYGENGSGKSSIYNAVKDFFHSSENSSKEFDVNFFSVVEGNDEGIIELGITELDSNKKKVSEIVYSFGKPDAKSNHRQPEIRIANKVKGFLDYKKMLQAHSLEVPANEIPNVFNLLVKELLAEHTVANPQGGVATVELLAEYNRLVEILTKTKSRFEGRRKSELTDRLHEIKEELEEIDEESAKQKDIPENLISRKFELENEVEAIGDAVKIIDAKVQLAKLSDELLRLLQKVFTVANGFLAKYFRNKIFLDINFSRLLYDSRLSKMQEQISLKIKYSDEEIPSYHVFLNEARLSSIALCLYLASIKEYPRDTKHLQVLYLDDVFIGLDTTNRFPLLEIIKEEFIKDGFQVFMSTYDREWFELSRHWFQTKVGSGKIKSLELFIEDDGNPKTPDYPIVYPYEGNFAKAVALFKSRDYPAAGNYLRKECEAIIKDLLPDNYKLDGMGTLIDDLEGLMKQLDKLYEDSNLTKPKELIDSIKIYRKALLNPSSHSDSRSPLFKKEIQDAFEIVDKLRMLPKISRTQILAKGLQSTYINVEHNYTVEIELAENVFKIEYGADKAISKHKFRITKWTWNGTDYAINNTGAVIAPLQQAEICDQKRTIEEVFKLITHSLKIPLPADLNSQMRIGVGGTLKDLLK